MASVLRNLFSRLGAINPSEPAPPAKRDSGAMPASARVPAPRPLPTSGRVPVIVRDYDLDEETARGPSPAHTSGASVRNYHCEREAEIEAPTGAAPRFEIRAAGMTHQGMRKASNEDALLVLAEQAVYVVADGMGGHAGGGLASQLAVDAIADVFRDEAASGEPRARARSHVPLLAAELVDSIGAANDAIRDMASKDEELSEMGTTLVAARFDATKGRLYVGHVGDSRCYRLRDGALKQLTRDHTMTEFGVTGREGAFLSRVVGPKALVEADVSVIEPRRGDVYLLCTDGLTKMVSDTIIRDVLRDEGTAEAAAAVLIGRANAAGGRDNVTALVIRVASPSGNGDNAID